MDITVIKFTVIFLSFASALIGIFSAQWVEVLKCTIFGQGLASGVLLAAGLVHMLPDAEKLLSNNVGLPLAHIVAGFVFVLLVVIEETAIASVGGGQYQHGGASCVQCGDECCDCDALESNYTYCAICPESSALGLPAPRRKVRRKTNLIGRIAGSVLPGRKSKRSSTTQQNANCPPVAATRSSSFIPDRRFCRNSNLADLPTTIHPDLPGLASPLIASDPRYPAGDFSPSKASSGKSCGDEGDGAHGVTALTDRNMPLSKVVTLFGALCFHSVMEGLGLGSAADGKALMSFTVAILAHKGLAAFALGTALRKSQGVTNCRFVVLASIFASGTPLGGMIGWCLARKCGDLFVGVCTASASGTFLQVSVMEFLPSAIHAGRGNLKMVLSAVTFGFSFFAMLTKWC